MDKFEEQAIQSVKDDMTKAGFAVFISPTWEARLGCTLKFVIKQCHEKADRILARPKDIKPESREEKKYMELEVKFANWVKSPESRMR